MAVFEFFRPASGLACFVRHSRFAMASLALVLASCGGGGGGGEGGAQEPNGGNTVGSGGSNSGSVDTGGNTGNGNTGNGGSGSSGGTTTSPQTPAPDAISVRDAHRFLTQATFGPTDEEIARVQAIGYEAWIDEQFGMRLRTSHLQTAEAAAATLKSVHPLARDVLFSWWTHAVKDPAQLRQRLAFALSEIFVVSTHTVEHGGTVASYMDMLTDKGDLRFRDLLEAVALHPAMGRYLSHLGNRKEDPLTGRVPDENFAREVMQLFSIGLYELDDSGRPKLLNGAPIETYSADDVKGLAKVFTGLSWNLPSGKASVPWYSCFMREYVCESPLQFVSSMSAYAPAHSVSAKQFLGVTVPAQTVADPQASLKAALDRLSSHPNVAPFISKQLIQRLVTSNPSDRYVSDITQVFRANQGSLRAVVKAILLHKEARNPDAATLYTYGKIREPVIRYAHILRTIPHVSDTYAARAAAGQIPYYRAEDTSDPGSQLGQAPMSSPSVFNFFRPGYQPQQTLIAQGGLVAPEMQITSETSILGFANAVAAFLDGGWGQWNPQTARWDVQFDVSRWDSLATNPAGLIDAIAQKMLGKVLPEDIRAEAIASLQNMEANTTARKRMRTYTAIMFVVVSPDFVVQQ